MNDLISRLAAIDAALEYLVEYCGGAFDEAMSGSCMILQISARTAGLI